MYFWVQQSMWHVIPCHHVDSEKQGPTCTLIGCPGQAWGLKPEAHAHKHVRSLNIHQIMTYLYVPDIIDRKNSANEWGKEVVLRIPTNTKNGNLLIA